MESPGEYIKREREHRGFTLTDIHEATRVPIKCLEALEADDYDALPHATFVKGFIKSYCRHLGLDENDAVLRYELYVKEKSEKASQDSSEKKAGSLTIKPVESSGSKNILVYVAVGLAVIIIFYVGSTMRGKKGAVPESVAPAVEEVAVPEKSEVPVEEASPGPLPDVAEESPQAASEAAVAEPEKKHTLSIDAVDEVWVEVTIDDGTPFDVTLQKGERIVWKAAEKFTLLIGNAGGVELTYDGKVLSRPGEHGQVKKVTLPGWKPRPRPKTAPPKEAPPVASPLKELEPEKAPILEKSAPEKVSGPEVEGEAPRP